MRRVTKLVAIGLCLSGVAGGAVHASQGAPSRDDSGALQEEGRLPLELLQVGDCFDDPEGTGAISSVRAVPCDRPHDNEVYHLYELPSGPYPGDQEINERASEGCLGAFEGYVGASFDESRLESSQVTATEEAWDNGDHGVICFAYLPSGEKLTSSVRGQGLALDDATGDTTTEISPVAAVLLALAFTAFFVLIFAAMWRIFTKAGEAGWKSLIPIWNVIVLLRVAGRPAWWLVLLLVPLVNIVVAVIMYIDLAKAFGKGVGFGLGMLLLGVVFLPILAFGDAQYRGRVAASA